jgi:hypothetical protein
MKKSILFSFVLFFGGTSFAQSFARCLATDQKAIPSTTCVTTKGMKFQRYIDSGNGELGWLDLDTKVIWYDSTYYGTYYEARDFCTDQSKGRAYLPDNKDLIVSSEHGLREVARLIKYDTVWSFTSLPFSLGSTFPMSCEEFYFPPTNYDHCFAENYGPEYAIKKAVGLCINRIK